jgi:glucoamylase
VRQRYVNNPRKREPMEVWKADRRVRLMKKDSVLRIVGTQPFRLRCSSDNWHSQQDSESRENALQIYFVDLPAEISSSINVRIRFTFFWLNSSRWEGEDYDVTVQ